MNHSVINSIMKPHRTRGESKYMLEEIYFSDLCGSIEKKDKGQQTIDINPQKAWFHNGQYRFQFPSLWYQSTCNNKAIGLRSIKLVPDSVRFKTTVVVYKNISQEEGVIEWDEIKRFDILIHELPDAGIMPILSDMLRLIQSEVERLLPNEYMDFLWYYNYKDRTVDIEIRDSRTNHLGVYGVGFHVDQDFEDESQCGMLELLNTTTTYLIDPKSQFTFLDVWNRESLFVHASFVNGTSFQVLGTNGEFYTKPSKMYRFNGNSPEFYFELSHDGIHPVKHRFARFIVQLSFIYNDADYMAE